MPETKVNSSLFSKFKKTQVNNIQKLPDITGLTLDEFHIDSRLGIVSGEADIYLCSRVNDKSGKSFLLKYYRRENAVKTDVIEKLKTVNSPCVAPIEGFGEYEGHQYVARPYYEMSALSELLAEGTRFSEEELKKLIIPSIIEGLKAVHDAGILHKDLKPANMIPDDNGEHIVLIDFGISSDAGKNTFVLTQTGMTPFYAAPEAIQGIFHRETDYYALGITIFELFTGFTPFQNPGLSGDDAAKLAAVSKIEFPDNFPDNLKKLVLGLTYKDISHRNEKDNPNKRWGYDEVKRWLQGEDVPVPGEASAAGNTPSTAVLAFPPYRFNGTTCRTEDELIRALLTDPELGIRDLRRGVLTHHYFTISEKKGELCEKAEKLIENSNNKEQDFVDFLFSLAPDFEGFGEAVFGNREYEFKNAGAFLSYIDGLEKAGNYYEIRHIFKSYRKALKVIPDKTWPSDTYRNLEQMAASTIKFGERIFRDDKAFAEYLENIIATNENTPLNLKNFVAERERVLSKLGERPALAGVINRIMKFRELKEPEAVITVNGIKYSGFIKFGSYSQGADGKKAPIEWLVLEFSGNEALLISRFGLDCRQYHNEKVNMTWEKCDLREWLNNDFLEEAFSGEEVKMIKVSDLRNNDNPEYHKSGGNSTRDRVFCLSISEAERYFEYSEERQCQPTKYARNKDVYADGDDGCCWWLRSPGNAHNYVSFVRSCGAINLYGDYPHYNNFAVRPALRIILNQ